MEYEHIVHSFEPIFDSASQILILGTLPSVKSRETNFYYGHKQNRFWKVLAALFQEPIPETIDEKKHLLLRHHIAIWDVIQSCDIKGSSDSSIKNKSMQMAARQGNYIKNISFHLQEWKLLFCHQQVRQMQHGHLNGCVKHGEK